MRLVLRLVSLIVLVGIAAAAEATPVYYTFTGEIEFAVDYSTGAASVPSIGGISVGQIVAWTFVADTDLPGYYIQNGVNSGPFGPPEFYDAFVSGDTLGPVTGSDYFPSDFHWGLPSGGPTGYFYGTPHPLQSYNFVEIDFPSLAGLAVGQSGLFGWNLVGDLGTGGSGLYAAVGSSNFTLTNISDPAQVPEPGTVVLLGVGLVGLVALRSRGGEPRAG